MVILDQRTVMVIIDQRIKMLELFCFYCKGYLRPEDQNARTFFF